MFGSAILDVAIGIIFIFLLVSILCSAVREGMEAWLKTRAAYLEYGVRELLHDRTGLGLAAKFYQHPLIYSLFSGEHKPPKSEERPGLLANGDTLPSYIPARNFATALLDLAARGPETDVSGNRSDAPVVSLDAVRGSLKNLGNPAVERVLRAAIDSAQGDLAKAQANIEAWYDSSMDRVSGWYKRSTQWILFWTALVTVVAMNINVITIGDYLYRNDAAREVLVAKARTAASDATFLSKTYEDVKKEVDEVNLPIGWARGWGAPRGWNEAKSEGLWNNLFGPILGWLLVAMAATMGAPFWFDVLNKVMVIRSTVKPHEKSPEEASEDRQLTTEKKATADLPARAQTQTASTTPTAVPVPADSHTERDVDGCDVDATAMTTPDDQLPAAKGGVAT